MRRSGVLRQQRDEVEAFVEALSDFLEMVEPVPDGLSGRFHVLSPKDGLETKSVQARAKVSGLSGAAAQAAESVAGRVSLASPPMVGGFVKNINPITNWTMMLQPPNELDAPFVFDYCHQAMGELESRAAKAERDERSLAGRIARFLSFPSEIRRLAGGQSRAGQVAAFGIGVFLQGVAVTVVGGLVLAGIIALLIRIF